MTPLLLALLLLPPAPYDVDAAELARVYVAEASWSEPDHQAIFWAIRNRSVARNIPFGRQMRAYARGLRSSSNRATWVRNLNTELTEPEGWPEDLQWDRHRGRWGRVLARARTDLVFPPPNPCRGRVEHWAGMRIASDRRRAARAVREGRWRVVRCSGTRNTFLEVVGRRRLTRRANPGTV